MWNASGEPAANQGGTGEESMGEDSATTEVRMLQFSLNR
jgi:hypothetical protein